MKKYYTVLLLIESAVVLIQLAMRKDAWLCIFCYWFVVLMKNIDDLFDEKKENQ